MCRLYFVLVLLAVGLFGCTLSGGNSGREPAGIDARPAQLALPTLTVPDAVEELAAVVGEVDVPTSVPAVVDGSSGEMVASAAPVQSPTVEYAVVATATSVLPTAVPTATPVPLVGPWAVLEPTYKGPWERLPKVEEQDYGEAVRIEPVSGRMITKENSEFSGRPRTLGASGGPPPAAGGSANPNDELFPLVYFEGYGVNPFIDADEDGLSTFSLDGDAASWYIAETYLDRGFVPPPDSVRVEEWLNAFDSGYAEVGDQLGLKVDVGPSVFGEEGYRMVRIGINPGRPAEARQPVSLIFLLDVSGSMEWGDRIGLAKDLISGIALRVGPLDRVAVVTYGSRAEVVSGFVGGSQVSRLVPAVQEISVGGSTFVEDGIRKAYQLAAGEAEGRSVRVVLLSDGVGNVGATGPDSILDLVDKQAQRSATLTAIGVGLEGNYNDVLLEALANRGNGVYHYVGNAAEVKRFLSRDVEGVFRDAVRDARVQVEFNPLVVRKYRLLGYENRAVSDDDFRNDELDFGEVGFARSVTALYEVRLESGDLPAGAEILEVFLRWRDPVTWEVDELSRSALVSDLVVELAGTDEFYQRDLAVAEFAELMRSSYWAQCGSLGAVRDLVDQLKFEGFPDAAAELPRLRSALGQVPGDYEVHCQQ